MTYSTESVLNYNYQENSNEIAENGAEQSPEQAGPMEVMALDFRRGSWQSVTAHHFQYLDQCLTQSGAQHLSVNE